VLLHAVWQLLLVRPVVWSIESEFRVFIRTFTDVVFCTLLFLCYFPITKNTTATTTTTTTDNTDTDTAACNFSLTLWNSILHTNCMNTTTAAATTASTTTTTTTTAAAHRFSYIIIIFFFFFFFCSTTTSGGFWHSPQAYSTPFYFQSTPSNSSP
jgi:hypothetical protein